MAEIWKSVPSLPGVLASSKGRILLPPRHVPMPNGGYVLYATKPRIGSVCRSKKGAKHKYRGTSCPQFGNIKIHQAVCEAFHGPQPFPTAVVLHRDEDGLNNVPGNLKWGTQLENLNMPKVKAYHRSRIGDESPRAKWLAKQAAR